ncbi:MAG: MBL fold metallo-hydrolase, partial [Acidobacteriota bacterium]|nr:MBL fold metallo-hydrolase [Acidobacteriota bacterium]
MISRLPSWIALAVALGAVGVTVARTSGRSAASATRTTIVMLGTGTPIPDPDRSGPAVAVVVDGTAYLFDAGAGVVRRAAAASRDGVAGLRAAQLGHVFLTHLHSDHTMGLNDVMFTPWIQGRTVPLEIFGPPGTSRLVRGILDGNDEDIQQRIASADGPSATAWQPNVHEIAEGVVHQDARIAVRAFAVPHSTWRYAFGYRITTPDRTIVLSGDTRANPAVARECNGCDVLIHEVYADAGLAGLPEGRRSYHRQAHTSGMQVGDIAAAAKPGLLVLYHQLYWTATDEELLREVRARFTGRVVSAK